jgi:hypothetical protein
MQHQQHGQRRRQSCKRSRHSPPPPPRTRQRTVGPPLRRSDRLAAKATARVVATPLSQPKPKRRKVVREEPDDQQTLITDHMSPVTPMENAQAGRDALLGVTPRVLTWAAPRPSRAGQRGAARALFVQQASSSSAATGGSSANAEA